jgi:hypothetical protein
MGSRSWYRKPVKEGTVHTGEMSVLCRCGLDQPLEPVNLQAVPLVLSLPTVVPVKIPGSVEYRTEWAAAVLAFSE